MKRPEWQHAAVQRRLAELRELSFRQHAAGDVVEAAQTEQQIVDIERAFDRWRARDADGAPGVAQ